MARKLAIVACCFAGLATLVGFLPFGVMQLLDLPMACVGAVALAAALAVDRERAKRLVSWRVAWAVTLLVAWALVSTLFSGRLPGALYGNPGNGTGWLVIAASGAAVLAVSTTRAPFRPVIVKGAPWLAGLHTLIVFVQVVIGPWPAGGFSNPSYFGMAMGLLLPVVAIRPDGASRRERWARDAVLALGLVAVGISGARAGLIVLVWALVALWAGRIAPDLAVRTRRIVSGAAGAAAVLAGAYSYRVGGVGAGEVFADRTARLGAAFRAMLDRPITGWGPDGFTTGAARHVPEVLLQRAGLDTAQFGADPHNLVAYVGASLGIVGLVLTAWVMFEVVRNWRRQSAAGRLDQAFAAAVVLYIVQAFFAPMALQTLPLAILAGGVSLAVERRAPEERSGAAKPGLTSGIRVVMIAIPLVLTLYGGTRLVLPADITRADPRPLEVAATVWRDPFLWYRASAARAFEAQRDPALVPQRQDLAAIRRAVELESDNPVYLTELARTLAYYGEPAEVVDAAFDEVYGVFPLSPNAHAAHAEYYIVQGDLDAAWARLEPVSDLDSPEVWRVLARYYSAAGDSERADEYQHLYDAW